MTIFFKWIKLLYSFKNILIHLKIWILLRHETNEKENLYGLWLPRHAQSKGLKYNKIIMNNQNYELHGSFDKLKGARK